MNEQKAHTLGLSMETILRLNGHVGHSVISPQMRKYIYGMRRDLSIFNLDKVIPLIRAATMFLNEIGNFRGTVLFLGSPLPNERNASNILDAGHHYIQGKWIGGLLTNYEQVSKTIEKMNKLLRLQQSVISIHSSFYGLINMKTLPDVIVIWNIANYKIAIEEAFKLGIPVIGLVDSDESDAFVAYPMPGNSNSREFIYFMQDLFLAALRSDFVISDN